MNLIRIFRYAAGFTAVSLLSALFFATMGWAESPTYRSKVAQPQVVAGDPFSYTGLYLDLAGGYGVGDSELTAEHQGHVLSIDGLSSRGFLGQARIGFDIQPGRGPFVLGIFGGYGIGSMDFDASLNTAAVSAELEPTWHAGARAGIIGPGGWLLYGGYAYGEAELRISGIGDQTLPGHTVLAGLEVPLSKAWTLKTEYNYTMYDSARVFDAGAPGLVVDVETDVHVVWGRLVFRPVGLFGN